MEEQLLNPHYNQSKLSPDRYMMMLNRDRDRERGLSLCWLFEKKIRLIRLIGLCASFITFLYSPVPRIQFDPSTAKSQFVESLRWLPYENINFFLGIDGISLFFVILTTFLIPICILVGWSGMRSYGKEYITASLIREFLMIAVFRMLDLLLFYVFPESEGVLLGVCRGCVCSREWIPRQVSLGGVDTLARIRVTATREKSKGNCTRPGMDGRIDPFSIIPKKDCWLQMETFLWPPSKGNAGRVKLGRGFENRVLYRPHSIFLPNEPIYLLTWKTGVAFGSKGMVFSMSPDRAPTSPAGPYGRASPATQAALFATTRKAKDSRVQAENTCIDSGLMTRADDGSSGRSRMMRKSHLRPTTTGQFRFGATPYSTIIIGVWGSRQRKIKAAYQFFLYTLLGSVFMLLAILLILLQTGTTDLQISLTTEFSERRQIFLWIASFASFAVKVPMVPVHIWLPEAHVEAPTAGSVILAGIPLKLGTYGFLRFSIPMFPEATLCFTPFIYTLSAIAIIYTSLTTSRQIDLKKIIAYSSVAHMNLVTIGMFSRAAAVRSPILSYGHTRPKHVCRACDPSTY
uniref:NADH-ubiquinone oxidoreductase chain 4 n=3 Tax=rosids TaxID=71275 RepID=A0A0D2QRC7_GOSRA|nr:hypothetical protein B456_001G166300 [Gossypium raimondii]